MSDHHELTVEEAARRLGLSRRSLERRAATGNAPRSVKLGASRSHRRVYPRAAVELWLVEHKRETSSTRYH